MLFSASSLCELFTNEGLFRRCPKAKEPAPQLRQRLVARLRPDEFSLVEGRQAIPRDDQSEESKGGATGGDQEEELLVGASGRSRRRRKGPLGGANENVKVIRSERVVLGILSFFVFSSLSRVLLSTPPPVFRSRSSPRPLFAFRNSVAPELEFLGPTENPQTAADGWPPLRPSLFSSFLVFLSFHVLFSFPSPTPCPLPNISIAINKSNSPTDGWIYGRTRPRPVFPVRRSGRLHRSAAAKCATIPMAFSCVSFCLFAAPTLPLGDAGKGWRPDEEHWRRARPTWRPRLPKETYPKRHLAVEMSTTHEKGRLPTDPEKDTRPLFCETSVAIFHIKILGAHLY